MYIYIYVHMIHIYICTYIYNIVGIVYIYIFIRLRCLSSLFTSLSFIDCGLDREAKLERWAGFYVDSATLATAYNAKGLSLNFYMSYNLTHHDAWTGNLFFRGIVFPLVEVHKLFEFHIRFIPNRQSWGNVTQFEVFAGHPTVSFQLRIPNSISMASPVLLGVRILLECVDYWLLSFAEFFYKTSDLL